MIFIINRATYSDPSWVFRPHIKRKESTTQAAITKTHIHEVRKAGLSGFNRLTPTKSLQNRASLMSRFSHN
jgi:hypothetical protein